MSIVRVQKKKNPFVQIDHRPLNDARLSWRARGVLSYLLSKPDCWEVRMGDLLKKGPEGRDALRSAMQELRKYGYADLKTVSSKDGKMAGRTWEIYEVPIDCLENRPPENPSVGKTPPSNNNFFSNKNKRKNEASGDADRIPSLTECLQYGEKIGLSEIESESFYLYQSSAGWRQEIARVRTWKAGMRFWKDQASELEKDSLNHSRHRES